MSVRDARRFSHRERPLAGDVVLPGDKSMTHRALMFASGAEGTSRIEGLLVSADTNATREAMVALGVTIEDEPTDRNTVYVTGWGQAGPTSQKVTIDCGNSGTTARLLLGYLSGAGVHAVLTGDRSLSLRPMGRVVEPLRAMGCDIRSQGEACTLPLEIRATDRLHGADIDTNMSSAQVKSALLLAGMFADGATSVTETARSRDHTERMLPAFGVPVHVDGLTTTVVGPARLRAADIRIPGDPSSAAFFAVAATCVEGSDIILRDISLNETRVGFLEVMRAMGASIEVLEESSLGNERIGTIRVRYAPSLTGTTVTSPDIPLLIDEIPILALLATRARSETRFSDVGELRVKESDRLEAIRDGLATLGGRTRVELIDGREDLIIEPVPLGKPAILDSRGDHRLAMTWAVAGLLVDGGVTVEGFEAVDVSFPGFEETLDSL